MVLTLLTVWSVGSFWFLNQFDVINFVLMIASLAIFYLIWSERSAISIVLFLSFSNAFALYGFLFYLNLPLYVIMIAILLIFGYIFTYFEQINGVLGRERLVFLLLFSLVILEIFVILSYFLISPINQSLIIALASYVICGFSLGYLKKDREQSVFTYLIIFAVCAFLILITAQWSGTT